MMQRRGLRSSSELGKDTRIASSNPKPVKNNGLALKYRLQDGARKLLPSERVARCFRMIQPGQTSVKVLYNSSDSTAHYGGCTVCGSVWACPICAARISEGRRKELTLALSRTDKHAVLVTYTIRHHLPDALPVLLGGLLKAFRAFKSGRWFKSLKHEYSWFGSVRSLEATHGDNGWHPHLHELVLFDTPPSVGQLEHLMRLRWMEVLNRFGLDCDYEIGVKVTNDSDYIREYVAKFGREPLDKTWGIEHELTKSNVKRSHNVNGGGRTPFQLLFDYVEKSDRRAGALFREYVKAFKGRNQLVWSRGLKDELGIEEISDEILAAAAPGEVEQLIEISYWDWQKVCELGARGWLLDVAAAGDAARVSAALQKIIVFHSKMKKWQEKKRKKENERS